MLAASLIVRPSATVAWWNALLYVSRMQVFSAIKLKMFSNILLDGSTRFFKRPLKSSYLFASCQRSKTIQIIIRMPEADISTVFRHILTSLFSVIIFIFLLLSNCVHNFSTGTRRCTRPPGRGSARRWRPCARRKQTST